MTRELFQPGDWLGDFEILGRLRAGGMATLFLGRRHGAAGVSRPVAIKVIHPHLAEDELIVRMFIDEARISSHISHSNVVYVEKFGEHDGVYYIVMEYVDGCSLEQLLRTLARRGEQIAPEIAVHIAIEAAAGLHAAHETTDEDGGLLGIVHRDVSPSNVLLTRDGRVKVIDFGIAKARGRLGATRSGANLKGKLRYMSPEQAWGRPIDRRTDVYALGLVLWELLAVRPLFRGDDDLAVLEQVRNPQIGAPSEHNRDVTAALDAVVSRATAKDPAHRLQTALALRRELMQAVPSSVAVPADAIGRLVALVRETLGVAEVEDRKATTPARRAPTPFLEAGTTQVTPSQASSVRAAGELHAPPTRVRARGRIAAAGLAVAAAIAAVVVALQLGGGAPTAASVGPIAPVAPSVAAPARAPAVPETVTVTVTATEPVAPPPAANAAQAADDPPATRAAQAAGDPPATRAADVAGDPSAQAAAQAAPAAPRAAAAQAAPAELAKPTKAVAKPARPRPAVRAAAPQVHAVEVDGVILADEPATPARPAGRARPRPASKPRADGIRVDGTVLAE